MLCHSKFTLVRRRHHCRRCGACVCGTCSKGRVPLSLLPNQTARRKPPPPSARQTVPTSRPGDPPRSEPAPPLSSRVAETTYRAVAHDTALTYVRVCRACAKAVDAKLKDVVRRRAAPVRRGTFDETGPGDGGVADEQKESADDDSEFEI